MNRVCFLGDCSCHTSRHLDVFGVFSSITSGVNRGHTLYPKDPQGSCPSVINAEAEMLGASQPQRLLSGSRFYVGPGRQVVLFDAICFGH